MSGGMEGMMEGTGRAPPKELFPSLMDPASLTAERRAELERMAYERMSAGTAALNEGLARFEAGAQAGDQAAMREGIDRMRHGLDLLESGEAARQALSNSTESRATALRWFKREMDLDRTPAPEAAGGILGLSWFHFFVMLLLGGFAAVMVWMYYHKMRRAADLLQALAGTPGGIPAAAPKPPPTPLAPAATPPRVDSHPPGQVHGGPTGGGDT
ncbi:MAG TPA: hypothetical protein VKE40_15745 [Gemmataceae bacterium]|nr:hypothetical protein [Gemmataceae bacterium]